MERKAKVEVRARWMKEREELEESICKVKVLDYFYGPAFHPTVPALTGVFVLLLHSQR